MRLMSPIAAILLLLITMPAAPEQAGAGNGLTTPAATDFSSARKNKSKRASVPARQYRHGPGTIACTRAGCTTVPPGCHAIRERSVDDSPTGFQIIVC